MFYKLLVHNILQIIIMTLIHGLVIYCFFYLCIRKNADKGSEKRI